MSEPNRLLRAARERTPSRHRPGRYMSREELAEAVALWACEHDGKHRGVAFDANHLGKLERGTVRCPRQLYVDALCAVLNATPAELGFDSAADKGSPLLALPDPVGVLDPDERERLSLAAVQPCRTDGAALEALAAVLFAVRQLEDETGAAAVFPIVEQQRILADRLAAGVPVQARPAAIGLSSEMHQYLGWLSIPLGRWDDAHRYLDRAVVAALEADDPLRLSTALSFHAYAWLRTGDLRKADSLSEAAQRDTRVHSGLRTYLTYQRAEVLARDNNRTDAVRLLTKADCMVEQLPPPEGLPPSGYWYVPAFFLGQRGFVLHALGDSSGARRSALECLATMPEAGAIQNGRFAVANLPKNDGPANSRSLVFSDARRQVFQYALGGGSSGRENPPNYSFASSSVLPPILGRRFHLDRRGCPRIHCTSCEMLQG